MARGALAARAARAEGGRAAGRSAPPSRAASEVEPGRQADKAPPAPSPTTAHREGGEGGLEGCGRRKRRGRREGAAGGTRQDRAEEGGEKEGLGGLRELGGGKDS